MEQLPDKSNETSYQAKGMGEQPYYCGGCKKEGVVTFKQMVSTMPQDTENKIRKYLETFCAYCGMSLDRVIVDETVK